MACQAETVRQACKNRDRSEHHRRRRQASGRPNPAARQTGQQQHGTVADEKTRSHGAFDPREAGAFGAAQLRVVDPDEHHEGDEQQAGDGCAPAPETRDEQQRRGKGLDRSKRHRCGLAQEFRYACLREAYGSTLRVCNFPQAGDQKNERQQDRGHPIQRGLPAGLRI